MSKTVAVILNLKDQMSPKLFKVSKNVKNMSKDMQRASRQAANMANRFTSGVNKMVGKAAKLAVVGAKAGAAIAAVGAVALVKQSDAYSSIQARLKLINDGQQTVDEFNKKIFASADRARASYTDTADVVGKLGITAGNAFTSNDEILQFSELLSKSFKVGGASAQEQSASMYQLTQAMAAGKLQGDEFRSISENAPLLAQAIANEMGVSMGELKEMSSEGKITSDVIKAALLNSSDAINKQFAEMPMTFGEAMTKIKNGLTKKLEPTFKKMSDWLNSDAGAAAIAAFGDGIAKLVDKIPAIADALKTAFDWAKKIFNFIKDNQDVIIFVGTFVIAISGLLGILKTLTTVMQFAQVAAALFGGTLALTPVGLIVLGIAALIAVGVLLWKNWDTIKAKASELWSFVKGRFAQLASDVKRDWDQIKQAGSNAWGAVKTAFDNFKSFISSAFTTFIDGIKQKWQALKDFLAHPIRGTVNLVKNGSATGSDGGTYTGGGGTYGGNSVTSRRVGNRNALGTSYWKGGATSINERGGEIIDLPSGSRVIPADKSERMVGGRGVTIGKLVINARGITADEVVSEVVPKLKLALANM